MKRGVGISGGRMRVWGEPPPDSEPGGAGLRQVPDAGVRRPGVRRGVATLVSALYVRVRCVHIYRALQQTNDAYPFENEDALPSEGVWGSVIPRP